MKKLSMLLLLALLHQFVNAQKQDNIWVFGYDSNTFPQYPGADRITLNFSDSLTISYSHGGMQLEDSNISICDSLGNLLLLSNGCYIEAGDGAMVENSDSLNPGWVFNNKCNGPYQFAYTMPQNMVLLPTPDSPAIYYLFHLPLKFSPQPLYALYDKLLYTKIDMSLNNGNSKVVFKNKPLVLDTFHYDGFSAVRHANGRDWWIVTAKTHSNKYYLSLLTPNGIAVKESNIGEPTWSEAGGEIVFSPDGTKMARFNTRDDLRIFDFDRCSGELSNPIHIPIQDDADNELSAGLAFSADGRFLYVAEVERILQFDIWASDIAATKMLIAERKTNPDCPLGSSIGYLELTPDERIFSRPVSGSYCVHVINRPEHPDTACDFRHHQYIFDFAYDNLPHFPNFRLGPIDGSPCDTLGLDNHPLAGWRYDRTEGLSVDFTSVSWYEPTSWWWDFGDPASGAANQSTEKYPSHTFSAPGGYEVCLTVSNQYGSDTKCKMVWVVTSSSSSPQGTGEVRIFPNPTTGVVQWKGMENEEVTLRVYDALGRLCLQKTTSDASIDASGLPTGFYLCQIISSGRIVYLGKFEKH
jgi:hypothetical protein